MQDPWSIVIMVLLAVLVGACLPVLFMIFSTLGSVRQLIQQIGPKVDGVLKEVQETTGRLNSATVGMDKSAQRAKKLLDATGDLGESVQGVRMRRHGEGDDGLEALARATGSLAQSS